MDEKTRPRTGSKSSSRKFVEGFALISTLIILVSILFPFNGTRARENARRSSCRSNLKQILLSVKQYAQDYDEIYPPVASGEKADSGDSSAFGWADAIQPYLKSTQLFQCPSEENAADEDPTQPQYTDYWFNARIAGKRESDLEDWKRTIALGEGNDGADSTNARYHLLEIPQRWRKDEKSPLYRHLDGANFAFADGHVKALSARRWKNGLDSGDSSGATFRLKPAK